MLSKLTKYDNILNNCANEYAEDEIIRITFFQPSRKKLRYKDEHFERTYVFKVFKIAYQGKKLR